MNIFEKYKLYRNILKQKPNNSSLFSENCSAYNGDLLYTKKHTLYNCGDYKVSAYYDNYFIKLRPLTTLLNSIYWVNPPIQFYAFVFNNNDEYLCNFNFLLAKKLFNHGNQK
jgi:hypothetical protein